MGIRSNINPGDMASDKKKARAGAPMRLEFDVILLLVVITLIIFGSLMVYSASSDFSFTVYGSPTYVFQRQLMWLGLGSVIALFISFIDYHRWSKFSLWMMLGAIVLLILVLLLQEERLGAVRSLFRGSIQPSELAKMVIVVYLSVWLYNRRDQLRDIYLGLIPLGTIIGVIMGLIALQPDLSALVTVLLLGMMMFFLGGGDLKQILIVSLIGLIIGYVVLNSELFPTGSDRMSSYLDGLRDPLQYSHHVKRSLESFVKGGWLGVGIGKSETKFVSLPFPHTDSIFAVVGEETGFLGAAFLVIGYALIMWRSLVIANNAPDGLGKLLAAGLGFWLSIEAFINMAVMVGLMPFAGNALPFISAGGSNLVMALVAIGIIMSVSRMSEISKVETEKSFSALVDLRGRNRRRRVSSPDRPKRTR
jgi:cell division protein FtsW